MRSISCVKVAWNFLFRLNLVPMGLFCHALEILVADQKDHGLWERDWFRLSVEHVGQMNTQVWLLNSLVHLAGWVKSELVGSIGNTERMMFNSIHNVEMPLKCLTFCLFPLLARIAECSCQNRRMLGNYSPCQNSRMFGNKNSQRSRGFHCLGNCDTNAVILRVVTYPRFGNPAFFRVQD